MKTLNFLSTIFALLFLFSCPIITLAQVNDKNSPSILIPDAKLEVLFDGGFFTEGPAVGPDGFVYFSDITFTENCFVHRAACPMESFLTLTET
jgi:hypothetical protein